MGNNTDLKGGVIASDAEDKALNKLDTGTISFTNIENKADFDVSHVSINIGTGGGLSPTAGMPTIYNNSGSDHSTTKSAVEDGELVIRNQDEQKQDINQLSRDTDNANNPLGQIFDKQKELDRMEALELVKDIASQAKDIAKKADQITAQNKLKEQGGPTEDQLKDAKNKLGDKATDSEINHYIVNQMAQEIGHGNMGSSVSKGIDAATSIVTGLITGDITGGLAGASAPYLAEQIKRATGETNPETGKWEVTDPEANLIAHAILGAAVAQAQGNAALAGGAGAVTGEAMADIIRKELYGKDVNDLTENEKANISALAQLASGLAVAAVTGGDMGDTGTAVAGSKNAVENNWGANVNGGDFIGLSPITGQYMDSILHSNDLSREEAVQALQDLTKGNSMQTGSTEVVLIYSAPGVVAGAAMVAIEAGVPVAIVEGVMIGATSNGSYQLIKKPIEEFSFVDVAVSGAVGGITAGQGWIGTVSWSAAGGATSSAMKEDDIVSGVLGGVEVVSQIKSEAQF